MPVFQNINQVMGIKYIAIIFQAISMSQNIAVIGPAFSKADSKALVFFETYLGILSLY